MESLEGSVDAVLPLKPARALVETVLERCGIALDGSRPHDLRVHDQRLYARLLRGRSLALGESYMDAWWDCDDLEGFFARLLSGSLYEAMGTRWSILEILARVINR